MDNFSEARRATDYGVKVLLASGPSGASRLALNPLAGFLRCRLLLGLPATRRLSRSIVMMDDRHGLASSRNLRDCVHDAWDWSQNTQNSYTTCT